MKTYTKIPSPLGELTLVLENSSITGLYQELMLIQHELSAMVQTDDTETVHAVNQQLQEYWSEKRTNFILPLALDGTGFQKQVWAAIAKIPYGSTVTYTELAESINHPNAVRAVAHATALNPVPVIIPCHRVISIQPSGLYKYSGGSENKKFLLELEELSLE